MAKARNILWRKRRSSVEELIDPGPKPLRPANFALSKSMKNKKKRKIQTSGLIPETFWTPISKHKKGHGQEVKTNINLPIKSGPKAKAVVGGPSVDSFPPPPPSPYTLKEQAKREAYIRWIHSQNNNDSHDNFANNAAHNQNGADEISNTLSPHLSESTSLSPSGFVGNSTTAETHSSNDSAFMIIPYKGRRTLLRGLANDTDTLLEYPSQDNQLDASPKNASAITAETKIKKLAAIIVKVAADPRMLQRLSPIQREAFFRDKEAQRIGAKREVRCGHGWCDLLTSHEIVEVKAAINWRHALGQVLSYGTYWPDRQKRVHLFYAEKIPLDECIRICATFDVFVSVAES